MYVDVEFADHAAIFRHLPARHRTIRVRYVVETERALRNPQDMIVFLTHRPNVNNLSCWGTRRPADDKFRFRYARDWSAISRAGAEVQAATQNLGRLQTPWKLSDESSYLVPR